MKKFCKFVRLMKKINKNQKIYAKISKFVRKIENLCVTQALLYIILISLPYTFIRKLLPKQL